MNKKRTVILVLIALVAISGAFFIGAGIFNSSDDVQANLKKFNQILAIVEERYPDTIEPDKVIYSAIRGMLRNLDPHSNFLDEKAYADLSEEQQGKFYGLGIQIAKRGEDKPLIVISPIDNTPAKRAGIIAGDIITHIEGKDTMGMTIQDAVKKLKGPKGTKVSITIKRPGIDEPLEFTVERDEIPLESITNAFIIRPGTGYIRISSFNQTTYKDFDAAIKNLESQGMERLILDLRENSGGLLDQAVLVASRFVGESKMVVFTKGRIRTANQEFYSEDNVPHGTFPLIILVNRGSASASEIVSGAVQDHDRGLIIGETTFGKGLVQRSYPLPNNTGLLLTTARYYTPSGRLIQRDYSSFEDYYLAEELPDQPVTENQNNKEIRHTDSGRIVYGGGGITPDVIIKQAELSKFLVKLIRDSLFLEFSAKYNQANPAMDRTFTVTDRVIGEFKDFLKAKKAEFTEEDLKNDDQFLRAYIKATIFSVKWGRKEEAKVLVESDPQVQKALELFPEAVKLASASPK